MTYLKRTTKKMMIKPIGGMLLVTKKQEEDKTTKSGLVISAVFNDSGPKIGTIVDMGAGEVNYKGDLISLRLKRVIEQVFEENKELLERLGND